MTLFPGLGLSFERALNYKLIDGLDNTNNVRRLKNIDANEVVKAKLIIGNVMSSITREHCPEADRALKKKAPGVKAPGVKKALHQDIEAPSIKRNKINKNNN